MQHLPEDKRTLSAFLKLLMAVADFAGELRCNLNAVLPLLLNQTGGVFHWADWNVNRERRRYEPPEGQSPAASVGHMRITRPRRLQSFRATKWRVTRKH